MNAERPRHADAHTVTTRCGTREPRDVAARVHARGQEERVHHDLAVARPHAGLDPGLDRGRCRAPCGRSEIDRGRGSRFASRATCASTRFAAGAREP